MSECKSCGRDMEVQATHWEGCHTEHPDCAAYKAGFKAGLRRAAEICEKRADWIKGRQEGKPEELSNVILRHHAAAHRSASEEILEEADK